VGTRNLTAVFVGGKYTIAKYCQWDGYPNGQGVDLLRFLRDEAEPTFASKCADARIATKEEIVAAYTSCGAAPNSDLVSFEVSDKVFDLFPNLHRDMGGADALRFVQENAPGVAFPFSLGFAADSLFCEWAYVVDFDKGTFEVYEGFNKEPLDESERFANVDGAEKSNKEYYPVRLSATFSLSDLPSDEVFLKTFAKEDECDE